MSWFTINSKNTCSLCLPSIKLMLELMGLRGCYIKLIGYDRQTCRMVIKKM